MWTWCSWFPLDGGGGAAHQKTCRELGGGVVEDLVGACREESNQANGCVFNFFKSQKFFHFFFFFFSSPIFMYLKRKKASRFCLHLSQVCPNINCFIS